MDRIQNINTSDPKMEDKAPEASQTELLPIGEEQLRKFTQILQKYKEMELSQMKLQIKHYLV